MDGWYQYFNKYLIFIKKNFQVPHVKIFFVQVSSCKMLKLDHVDFFFNIYYIKSFINQIPNFPRWQNLIKKFVEIYGHP
jgi:hypothetical protein